MKEIEICLTTSIEVNSSPEKEYAQVLLRKATIFKKEGMLDDAISTLKGAYEEIAKTKTDFTIEPFLRLPAYLQAAGRPEAAWSEFQRLLATGYPNAPDAAWARHITEARIYDKMRLHLQREKDALSAIRYGVLSYVAALRAEQNRPEDSKNTAYIEKQRQTESVEALLVPLLKKAKCTERLPRLHQIVSEWVNALPRVDDSVYETKLDAAIRA